MVGNGMGWTASMSGAPKLRSGFSARSPAAWSPHQQTMTATTGWPSGSDQPGIGRELLGRRRHEIAVVAQYVAGLIAGVDDEAAKHGATGCAR